ncbi:Tc toxin subunit A [Arthrobacter sp. FX8]|uniref:Tc toxin subunit A n=1 Tax=Arthrobacter sp. FX8 TaxID=2997335 RepID=UPI00227AD211|nr:Tc toxin subunit A [Arthrobacter sp. FX8]WAJ34389.1 Tc toxin subunit A [Arthrobacter sp. FX8]
MNRITFDLVPGMDGPEVADLQNGLRLMLEANSLDLSERERLAFLERLRPERQAAKYGDITAKLVGLFQERNGIPATGEVKKDTASAMNEVLAELGAFEGQPVRTRVYVIAGQVTDQDGNLYAGLQVSAFHTDDAGSIRLGLDRSDGAGRYTIRFDELSAVPQIVLVVEAADDHGAIVARSDPQPLGHLMVRLDLFAQRPDAPAAQCRVDGRIVLDNGAPATALGIRLYRLDFGAQAARLQSGNTGAAGDYSLPFDANDRSVMLEVRAAAPGGGEVPLSKPLAVPAGTQVLRADLVAPATVQAAEAEYRRLVAALTPHVGQLERLADARENAQQRDLTALNAATGWDARLIAVAATAQKLEQDPEVKLSGEALYGLFRAGLPRDKHMLAQVEPEDVGVALKNLADNGIVAMTGQDIDQFKGKFAEFAREVRLAIPAPGSQTSYAELLKAARVEGAGDAFAGVFLKHRGDPAGLWKAAREAKIPDEAISKLQWQGKLAFLANNSGKVTEHLMSKLEGEPVAAGKPAELKSPAHLVSLDLYDAERWKAEVRGLAADDAALAALVPAAYEGKTVDDRLDAYAADMARKIRISYPTEVVTRMVETEKIKLDGAKDATVKLLQAAAPQGFTMGRTPVERFLSAGMTLPQGMAQSDVDLAKQEIKKLQRVYQITPTNESMPVLKELGLDSAFDITALAENDFYRVFDRKYLELYGEEPAEAVKRLVWRKAQQVSSMTYNIFGVARKLATDLAVPAVSGSTRRRDEDRHGLREALKGYPTMEELFGSMDFCECDHCRSVLSPAAYLVDLLQFVEAEPQPRANFLKAWEESNGKTYAGMGFLDPYEALTSRRPDLPHIPLTCENTNVALPYIDVVNEILEYYVATGGLAKDAAHDTGDATSAELLAEPQNVIAEAYRELLGEKYPLALPFDLWLETVREFCNYAETPLHRVLETLRTSEDFLPAAPGYGWAGIFIESLGLSPAERAIFADGDPLAAWWKLYGYDTEEEATAEATQNGQRVDLNSAKALSRRLGVTYKELVQLVKTTFVNPNLARLGVLYKLPASIAELQTFLKPENQTFLSTNEDLLGKDLTPAQQARVKALTKEEWALLTDLGGFADRVQAYADEFKEPVGDVMAGLAGLALDGVLVLADPDAGCSFDATILRYADGDPAGGDVFLRLNVFVRLWRKLGWSLAEVGQALVTFIPADEPFAEGHFDKKPLETALIYLAHLKALDERLKVGQPSRTRLLTLWTDIPTEGKNSLYAQLFLTRSVLKADKIFDHPQGHYLAEDWVAKQGQGKPLEFVLVKGHLPAIQSALGLTAAEVAEILADANEPLGSAKLTIANLSVLHRYGMLAKALRVSVHGLITLKALSGRHPFKPLAATP